MEWKNLNYVFQQFIMNWTGGGMSDEKHLLYMHHNPPAVDLIMCSVAFAARRAATSSTY